MKFIARAALFLVAIVLFLRAGGSEDLSAQPKFDPQNVFKKADSNGDGKISKEEWKKFSTFVPKLKDPPVAEAVFARLDTNNDGFLSLEEFKKIAEFRGKKEPDPKKEPEPKKKFDPASDKPATAEQIAFFEKKIRPVLVKDCYSCHSADAKKIKGGLTLDTQAGMREGGESGPAVVPGDAKASLILKALKHQDEKLKMPPKEKLSDEVVGDFEKWIAMGAPDPRGGSARVAPKSSGIDIEKGRSFWAFQKPVKAQVPQVKAGAWPRDDIDRFVLAALEAKGLTPVADADASTLIRRVYFDLIGLPPSEEELLQFSKDYAQDPRKAVETAVDKLLASPRFGERWGRHWLDVARYAETSGKQVNFIYPYAWRYRDYVVDAFNSDKPYDQFVKEQLAGDLIPSQNDKQTAEHLIATGFLALGPKSHNERSSLQFEMDLVDEQIDATFLVFQGLTVACARCHDHKFDPIPTKDYYALAGIFRSTETQYGTIRILQNNHPGTLVSLPKGAHAPTALAPLSAEHRASIQTQIKDLRGQINKANDKTPVGNFRELIMIANLESQLAAYEADGTPKSLAMAVCDRSRPADSEIFQRGELNMKGETVKRGLPQVLSAKPLAIGKGSGRLELASWIASRDNPLTARVMVNRVWLHLIGRGLVGTPDNFGASGQASSNRELLDHLAVRFADDGWSNKRLIRSIVLSRTYQLSSQFDAKNFEADPDNLLVWRIPKRRLEAESLRDAMLSISGHLDLKAPTGSPIATKGDGDIRLAIRFRPIDELVSGTHRSVYMPIVRDMLPESLTLFDFPDPNLISGERATTTIPAQSLYLMNNHFVIREAEAIADKLLASGENDQEKLARAYRIFFSRPPSAREEKLSLEFLDQYGKTLSVQRKGAGAARRNSWAALCQSFIASAEFNHR